MNQIQAFIRSVDPYYFSDYNHKEHEITDQRIKAYITILNDTVRLTNKCFYIVDFYNGSIPYMSYNPLYMCGLDPEIIQKQIDFSFNSYFASPEDIELVSETTRQWLLFVMHKNVTERTNYCLCIDYHLNRQLIYLSMTPLILSSQGYPVVILCQVNLSPRQEAKEAIILKNSCSNYWTYSDGEWIEKELAKLSEMELRVLLLSAQGKTENEICSLIFRSKDGLKTIKRKLFKKMDVTTITEAISKAISYRLIR